MPIKDKEARLLYWRRYHQTHYRKVRDRKLKKAFGISVEDYERLLTEQNGVCAVCFQPETVVHGGSKNVQPLAVDHNHTTSAVRGLLCSKCNTALGLLDEDESRMLSLVAYLKRHRP